jgi:hypothetical protein
LTALYAPNPTYLFRYGDLHWLLTCAVYSSSLIEV